MNPGRLNKRITIQQQDATQDSYGEQVETWTDVCTVWAKVNIDSGREFFAAQKINPELSGIIKIRYRTDINPTMRVVYKNRQFGIIKPPINVGEKNVELELHVRELV